MDGSHWVPGGAALPRAAVSSPSRWKVILAVWPSSRLMRSGSVTPGNCTRMRLLPWRAITGSLTPVSSIRRRTISIDWLHGTRRAVGNPAFRQCYLYARPVIAEAEVTLGLTDAGPSRSPSAARAASDWDASFSVKVTARSRTARSV